MKPIRVLVADDHAVVRDGLAAILNAQPDIEVVAQAGDGEEVLRQVPAMKPDVVLMDIAMPRLNGLEAAALLRERHPDVQVVILSMYATPEHIYQALKAGALGYLVKASAGQEVVQAVRAVAAGRRFLSAQVADTLTEDYLRRREAADEPGPLARLSPQERRVLQLVAEGYSSAEIAAMLHLSPKTVETYRHRIMTKLNLRNLAELIRFAIQHGLTPE
jgi:DNA-binding NarL/FixJ family response regulator